MLTAIAKIHWPKLWVTEGGLELPLVNLAVVIAVGLIGPGVVSLDNVFGGSPAERIFRRRRISHRRLVLRANRFDPGRGGQFRFEHMMEGPCTRVTAREKPG